MIADIDGCLGWGQVVKNEPRQLQAFCGNHWFYAGFVKILDFCHAESFVQLLQYEDASHRKRSQAISGKAEESEASPLAAGFCWWFVRKCISNAARLLDGGVCRFGCDRPELAGPSLVVLIIDCT